MINDPWFIEWTNGVLEKLQMQMWRNLQVHKSVTHCLVAMLLNGRGVCYWKFIKFYLLILANCKEFWIINWFLVKCLPQCHWSINAFVCKKCANHDFIAQLTKSKLFFVTSYRTSKALWDFFNMHICNADALNSLIWQNQYRWQVVSLVFARMVF